MNGAGLTEADAKRLLEIDMAHIWHPYTQMKDFEDRELLFIHRAEGVFLWDVYGNRYYDTISSWWCILHGHGHPTIKGHIRRQLDRLEQIHFAGTTHEGPIRLVEGLNPLLPGPLRRFFFSDNGSTANEVALKMSLQYWKQTGQPERERFVSLERGYHGDTIGTISLGGVPAFEGPFQAVTFDSYKVPAPYCYRCPAGKEQGSCALECTAPLEELLEKQGSTIAAMILEPMLMGAGGMIVYPAGYLKRVEELCRACGCHLILDEVATGFGRTGRMFAMEHAGVVPDFVCLSKGITGGFLPLAVTVTTDEIYDAFYADYSEGKTFFHGHTFTANPLAAAAAVGSLEVFREEFVMERLPARVERLQEGARALAGLQLVGDVRGIGMVAAFELVADKGSRAPFDPAKRAGFQVYLEGLKRGVILRPLSDVIYLFLPLCTTRQQIEDILDRTASSIEAAAGRLTA